MGCNYWNPQALEHALCNKKATAVRSSCARTKSSPRVLQLEKARAQQQRPTTAKNKSLKEKKLWDNWGYLNNEWSYSVQFSCSVVSHTLRPHGLQHARLPCPWPTARACSNSCPLRQWCQPTISSPVIPFSSCLQPFPTSGSFQMSQFLDQVAKVLEFQLQHQSFQWIFRTDFLKDGLVGSPCSPRDSQESSPTPQFKSINSSVLSFLYSPTLTSMHDYWKNHSFD